MAGRRTSKDDALALQLAGGRTIVEAAELAGVHERTARRWLDDAKFRAKVQDLRGRMIDVAAGKLAAGMGAAADVLVDVTAGRLFGKAADRRVRAARSLLEFGLRVKELTELEKQLAELTERVNRLAGGKR